MIVQETVIHQMTVEFELWEPFLSVNVFSKRSPLQPHYFPPVFLYYLLFSLLLLQSQ